MIFTWRFWLRLLVPAACLAVSAVVVEFSFSHLFMDGSSPATIWGPTFGRSTTKLILLAIIVAVALTTGRARLSSLVVWFVTLGLLTHRLVDDNIDGANDKWFALITVVSIADGSEDEPAPVQCRLAGLPALCVTRGGRTIRTPTVFRFAPMEGDGGPMSPS